MAHLIESTTPEKKVKKYTFKLPPITGKFGFSVFIGRKEVFIGCAVADVEVETVTRKRKKTVLLPKGKSTFIEI